MRFAFIYHGGTVPADKLEENGKDWGAWIADLHEKAGMRVGDATTVSSTGVAEYTGDASGISFIEANSLAEAQEMARNCPGIPYGGSVDVFEEYPS